jgi:tRNA G10  N-methylase Trm11
MGAMTYLAILGRQPEFGMVELESLLGAEGVHQFGLHAAILDRKLDINRLGGSVKLGRVLYQGPARDLNETPLSLDDLPATSGKTTFGLSYYGLQATERFVVSTGLTLKKRLRVRGSVRFVAPQTGVHLSAAQVKFNGLLHNGFELLVAVHKQEMLVAVTEQVQDIDWYATRDYERPSRSAKVGMLPPKLAQIMINTTSAPLVYDPFCGTGVVLQEALLLNRTVAGSDIAPEMVTATTDNLAWLRRQRTDLPLETVALADAQEVQLPSQPLAIVSEGYLGPHLVKLPTASELKTLQQELEALYSKSLGSWSRQLPASTEVTITLPIWHTDRGWHGLDIIDRLPDLGYDLRSFAHTNSRKMVYRRPQQIVGRQLLSLRKR